MFVLLIKTTIQRLIKIEALASICQTFISNAASILRRINTPQAPVFVLLTILGVMGIFSAIGFARSVMAQDSNVNGGKSEPITEKLNIQKVSEQVTQKALQQPQAYLEASYRIFASLDATQVKEKAAEEAKTAQPIIFIHNALAATQRPVTTSDAETVAATTGASGKPRRTEIVTYAVKDGDTISTIAAAHGITTNTVLWANDLAERSVIRIGQELKILPVSGIEHKVRNGEFLGAIAQQYQGDLEEIIVFNNLTDEGFIREGQVLIIPDGVQARVYSSGSSSGANPSGGFITTANAGYYARPTNGKRTQRLHSFNAVDLATSCGSAIAAAAPGRVVISDAVGWNGGYGKYIKIAHPNGTFTLYAHNSQNLVSIGQQVARGQVIAYMGTTGRSTGCHVHFEVHGATNPFAY